VQGICQPVAIYKMQILLQIIYLTSFMMNHFSHNTSAVRTCGCKKKSTASGIIIRKPRWSDTSKTRCQKKL